MYDLNTLVYLVKQPANYHWLTYVKSARAAGIPQVAFPDRKVRKLLPPTAFHPLLAPGWPTGNQKATTVTFLGRRN